MIKLAPYKIFIIALSLSLFTGGCIDEIDVFNKSTTRFVVDGTITNGPGPYKVTLGFSKVYGEGSDFYAVENASVKIIDDLGNEEILTYGYYGRYYTSNDFVGQVGRSYNVDVTLKDGSHYESHPELMQETGDLQSISYQRIVNNMFFYADLKDDGSTENYYRWRYENTFEFHAPFAVSPGVEVCWVSYFDHEFLKIDSDKLYNGRMIENEEIYSIPMDYRFNEGYSSEIFLYSLTESAFEYWSEIKAQIENNGTIFETNNYYIQGNIFSTDNPEEPVLGYFAASAVTTKRVFVGEYLQVFEPIVCEPSEAGGLPPRCTDCRDFGASSTLNKPAFWPY